MWEKWGRDISNNPVVKEVDKFVQNPAKALGISKDEEKKKQKELEQRQKEAIEASRPITEQITEAEGRGLDRTREAVSGYQDTRGQAQDQYRQGTEQIVGDYQDRRNQEIADANAESERLKNESAQQATDANEVYSSSIKPTFMNLMERNQNLMDQAPDIATAADPNSQIKSNIRDFYDEQAQGVGKRGMQSAGVLQAMGNQSLANQLGSMGPQNIGVMQALQAGNQAQAGQAFAQTQRQMDDIRREAENRAWEQSGLAYDRGVMASRDLQGNVQGLQGAQTQNLANNAASRAEQNRFGQDIYGRNMGANQEDLGFGRERVGTDYDFAMGNAGQDLGFDTQLSGMQQDLDVGGLERNLMLDQQLAGVDIQGMTNRLNQMGIDRRGRQQMLGSLASTGAMAAGTAMAGPVGGAAASAATQGLMPTPQSTGQTVPIGSGMDFQGYQPPPYQYNNPYAGYA